jgi:HemY protein
MLLAVLFTLFALEDAGFVMIGRGNWTLETSLAAFILVLTLLFFLTLQSTRIFYWLGAIPHYFINRYSRYHQRRATQTLLTGFSHLLQKQWSLAELGVLKVISRGELGGLHYLVAAYAAYQQQNIHTAQEYMRKAYELLPQYKLALQLWHTQIQPHPPLALKTAQEAYQDAPKNSQVLQNLASLYSQLAEWDGFLKLLPMLRKRNVLDAEQVLHLEQFLSTAILTRQLQHAETVSAAMTFWSRLPKTQRLQPAWGRIYVAYLLQHEETKVAEKLLCEILRYHWDVALLKQYTGIPNANHSQQIQFLESLLKQRSQDADLFEALGNLYMQTAQSAKAISHFEASLRIRPSATVYYALGELAQREDNTVQACTYFQTGLKLTLGITSIASLPDTNVPAETDVNHQSV